MKNFLKFSLAFDINSNSKKSGLQANKAINEKLASKQACLFFG